MLAILFLPNDDSCKQTSVLCQQCAGSHAGHALCKTKHQHCARNDVYDVLSAAGSAQGNMVLAANTLLMQFFIIFSYIMDGFAYAGESIGGHYYGARNLSRFGLLTRRLFAWGMALSAAFTLAYAVAGQCLLELLTNNAQVVAQAINFMPYACAIPIVSFAAFIYDGLFIGTTSTKLMLAYVSLWCAFLSYLGCRGLMQAWLYQRIVKKMRLL